MTTCPESSESTSQRLRVIASCDYCRVRKIKCQTDVGQDKCGSCIKRDRDCTYNARTHYYAERERGVVNRMTRGGTAGTVATTSTALTGPTSVGPAITTFASQGAQTQEPERQQVPEQLEQAPPAPLAPPRSMTPVTQADYPPISWMPYFIELFFTYRAAAFPFVGYEEVVGGFLQSTISPLLSNAIASLAAPYSATVAELAGVDPTSAPDYYAFQARWLLKDAINMPTLENLISLVLVAHIEYQAARAENMKVCGRHAANMAFALNLYDDNMLAAMSRDEAERQRLLSLRSFVTHLYQASS